MKVTIHQPEHFPYEGFFQKMKEADIFVILDSVKFKKNNFQNRNKLVDLSGNEMWFGFPVPKKSNGMIIRDVVACDESTNPWRKKLLKSISHNLKIDASRFYESNSLMDINMSGINWIKKEMKIKTPVFLSSELEVEGAKSELLLNICKKLGGKTYISGEGGREYLDKEIFTESGISVEFFQPKVRNYYSMLYNISKRG